jgi:hypothetical protein
MGVRETKLRSLEWIRDIRQAQRERSENEAAEAVTARDAAEVAVNEARQRTDFAVTAWLEVASNQGSFDHQVAMIWAEEMHGGERQLAEASSVRSARTDDLEAAKANWQRALSLSERASHDASRNRRQLAALQEERQLNELLEIRPKRVGE